MRVCYLQLGTIGSLRVMPGHQPALKEPSTTQRWKAMSGLAANGLKNDSVILKVKILSYIFTLLGNAIYCKHVCHSLERAVADPGFSPGGGANSQKCYYFSIFCRKLHENERIWTPRGGRASLAPPLGSANEGGTTIHPRMSLLKSSFQKYLL